MGTTGSRINTYATDQAQEDPAQNLKTLKIARSLAFAVTAFGLSLLIAKGAHSALPAVLDDFAFSAVIFSVAAATTYGLNRKISGINQKVEAQERITDLNREAFRLRGLEQEQTAAAKIVEVAEIEKINLESRDAPGTTPRLAPDSARRVKFETQISPPTSTRQDKTTTPSHYR